jgi:hypothetical protein
MNPIVTSGRPCKVCMSENRDLYDRNLILGMSPHKIVTFSSNKKNNISHMAFRRHMTNHFTKHQSTAMNYYDALKEFNKYYSFSKIFNTRFGDSSDEFDADVLSEEIEAYKKKFLTFLQNSKFWNAYMEEFVLAHFKNDSLFEDLDDYDDDDIFDWDSIDRYDLFDDYSYSIAVPKFRKIAHKFNKVLWENKPTEAYVCSNSFITTVIKEMIAKYIGWNEQIAESFYIWVEDYYFFSEPDEDITFFNNYFAMFRLARADFLQEMKKLCCKIDFDLSFDHGNHACDDTKIKEIVADLQDRNQLPEFSKEQYGFLIELISIDDYRFIASHPVNRPTNYDECA